MLSSHLWGSTTGNPFSNWREFDLMNIPVFGNKYGWIAVTSSTTGFSGAYFEERGDVTNMAYWGRIPIGTGFDLFGSWDSISKWAKTHRPKLCSGGGFGYGGRDFKLGPAKLESRG